MLSASARRAAAALALALGAALAPALVASCGDLPQPLLCGEIPAGGCPSGRGGSCDDLACAALYDCVDGAWTPTETCPPPDGGPPADGGDGGGGGGAGGGPCTPFTFDHTGETLFACHPDLENPPDCPAVAAEGCLETACNVGCDDFFICTSDGWIDVGYCDGDGVLHDLQD